MSPPGSSFSLAISSASSPFTGLALSHSPQGVSSSVDVKTSFGSRFVFSAKLPLACGQ
jgi:hypothetical protein